MISFDNTEKAFKAKSDSELSRSYWLFKLISHPALVKMGAGLGPLALNIGFKKLLKNTIFKQFVGGENINDCSETIKQLAKFQIGTILDYSVEGKESESDFENCFHETIETIHKAKNDKNIPFCVFKVTGLARLALLEKVSANATLNASEQAEWERVKMRVSKICQTAAENQQCIFIDAEESWIQQAIDDLANENMAKLNKGKAIVYNTFQLYRTDRLNFLNETIKQARTGSYQIGAKLVRGAYMEKERERAKSMAYPSPIQVTKDDTDKDYNEAVKLCIQNSDIVSVCAGTHNEKSSLYLVELMAEKNISNTDQKIYFSQLLGMSDHISYNLSSEGYNVAKYVPYGPLKDVMPYLIRRAQENTSVKGQTGRELNLIMKEKHRRNTKK